MLKNKNISLVILFILIIFLLTGCKAKSASDNVKSELASDKGNQTQEILNSETEEHSISSDRKLIEYWDITIEVQNVTTALQEIQSKTKALNGYLLESQVNNNTNHINAHLIIKIPQNKTNEITNYLQKVGRVTNSSNRAEDITMEYYDTEARLNVLKKQEERLLQIMDEKTANIQDLLAVEQELSRVIGERESLQARMNYLINATSYSQINIHIKQISGGEITTPKGTWGKAFQGLITSLNSLLNLGNYAIIAIFMALPYLVIIGIIVIAFLYTKKNKKTPK